MSQKLLIASFLVVLMPLGNAYGTIFRDDFTTTWDYSGGTVEAGSMWSGVYNGNAGGTQLRANSTNPGQLTMGMSGVGWENANDSGPLLYKEVNAADFVRVTAKITQQTAGNWSLAGVFVREPNPIDNVGGQEDWYASYSYRPAAADFRHQSNRVLNGTEVESNTTVADANAISYLRVESVAGSPGRFAAFRSADGVTWTPHTSNANATNSTNVNLANGNLQIGLGGGALGTLAGARTQFDWVEIETQPPVNCTSCSWTLNGSGTWAFRTNWSSTSYPPDANTVSAIFGSAFTGTVATVFTDTNVTVKELQFNNAASKYVIAGPSTITLDSDSGNALINVLAGTHEIQAHLALADNVTATAAAGTTLNINTNVQLNGFTLSTGGAGAINLNNGTLGGAGSGAGALVNGASMMGLSGVDGDLTQTESGRLAVVVGGAAIDVTGTAVLDGVLDVSLADGFAPQAGQSYTVLTAGSVTNLGLSLGGDAAGQFRLVTGANSVSLTAVPEPFAASLLWLGGCGLFGIMRFRAGGSGRRTTRERG